MSSLSVVSACVARPVGEVRDCHQLAWRAFQESRSDWAGGVYAALNWVTGGQRAPVTERNDSPVTAALARTEMHVAVCVRYGCPPPPATMWTGNRIAPREAVTDNREWA